MNRFFVIRPLFTYCRLVYEAFLEVFPSAYLLLSAVLFYCAGLISLFLFNKRKFLKRSGSDDDAGGAVKPIKLEKLESDGAAGSARF